MNDTKQGAPHSRSIFYLVVATLFMHSAIAGTRPLIPLYAVSLEIGVGEVGVLVAAFSLLPLLIATSAGAWMDSHNTAHALVLGATLAILGLMLPFFFPGRAGIYAAQVISGFGFTIYLLGAQSQAGSPGKDTWTRERHIALFSMCVALGGLAGPMMSGYLADQLGAGVTFMIMSATGGLGLFPLVVMLLHQRRRDEFASPIRSDRVSGDTCRKAPSRRSVWPEPRRILRYNPYMPRAFLVSVLILMAKDMYVAYFPIYALAAGISVTWIGIIIAAHNSGGVVMRVLMLPLVRAFGKNRVIITSVLFSGLALLVLPFANGVVALLAVSLAMGLGLGIGQPLSISRTINLSPSDKVGEVLGFRLTLNRLTQVVTPLSFGAVVLVTGIPGVFWILGLIITFGSSRLSVPEEAESGGGDLGRGSVL